MIYLNEEEHKKVEELDKLFSAIGVEDLKRLISEDYLVAKLKNEPFERKNLISNLIFEIINLRAEANNMRIDMQSLLRILSRMQISVDNLNSTANNPVNMDYEFSNLKSKYNAF